MPPANLWLSRFAKFVVLFTLALIFVGGMVTTLKAGMSVPDWPTTFGYNMFAFPISLWTGPAFWEHSHRIVATLLGVWTVVLAVWVWAAEPRRWLRVLAAIALVVVIIQGLMGGLRVTEDSRALAILHGCLAQTFLCLLVWIALALSPRWQLPVQTGTAPKRLRSWKRWAWGLTLVVFIQLILGALMRHLDAGLAIPTFPLMPDGSFFPSVHTREVHLHFTHRLWAVAVLLASLVLGWKVLRPGANADRRLRNPTLWLLALVALQIYFGISVILLARAPIPTSLHVINGALILMISFTLAIRTSYFSSLLPVSEASHAPHE